MIVLPAILMILIYTKIVLRRKEQTARILPQISDLRRHDSIIDMRNSVTTPPNYRSRIISTNSAPNSGSSSSLKRLTRIACAASAIVVVCWLPDQFYFCLFQLGLVNLRNELHNALIILAFLNTCLNPILYFFCDKQYAAEFKMYLCCCVYHRERTTSVVTQAQS
jgi:hypothetical protein